MNSNYDHDNLLEIRKRGQVSYISRGDYGDTSTALAPIDTQKIAREWGDEYVSTMNGMLRQYATPTIDAPGNRRPPVSGLSSIDELAARNERFRWTVIALIVLSSITTAGIVLIAVVTGSLTPALGVSFWVALTGISAGAATYHVHRTEQAHSPEAIELERVRGEFDIATQRGEIQGRLVDAIAESIILDAQTKRDNAEAQRAANLAYLESSKPVQRPQRAPVQAYDDSYQDYDDQPVCAPVAPTMAAWDGDEWEGLQPMAPIAPDKDLVAMLAEIDRIYAYCEERDSDIIKIGLEWATAGKNWSQDAKEKAARVLACFDPPLIHRPSENGAKYRLNRQQWSNKWIVRAMIAREWNN